MPVYNPQSRLAGMAETCETSMMGLLDYGKNHNHDYFGQY